MSSPNVRSLNGRETRPGDYNKVYSIIELVHLYGDGSKMCRDAAQEGAGNSWLQCGPEGDSTLNTDFQS